MERILLASIICTLTWIYPLHAASAIAEKEEPAIFINYEQFHKPKILPEVQSLSKTKPRVLSGNHQNGTDSYSGRHYSVSEVQQLIKDYSSQYKIDSDTPLCIAKLESDYNQFSKNKSSSASGVFQYLSATWKATDEGKAGLSVFDADANIRAGIKYMASRKSAKLWTVASKCPPIKTIN